MSKVVYKVKGMMCGHCVMHVQKALESALESMPGVKANVTLDPACAEIEFSGKVYDKSEIQAVIREKAGEYILED